EEGIGDWSDAEIAVLLRTGINPRRGGVYVPPYMPKLAHLSDEDLASIISYLRSDDPILKADGTPSADSQPSFLVKFLCRVAFTPLEFPKSAIAQPDSTNARALGKYLADGALDCYGCHSADFKTVDIAVPEKSAGYYGGGNPMLDINGNLMHTTNITSDKATGIGKWSEAEFVQAMQSGFRPDGSLVRYPMEQYKELSPRELSALYQFLMSTPAAQNPRKENFQYAAQGNAGEQAYYRYGCQYCHGTTGVGLADLRKAHTKFPADSVLADVILNPGKYKRGVKMPQWSGVIKEQDIAPLCTFVRELAAK
ncbi:MAG: c-type cytochrome, partial [Rhizobacter sp.]|nr:c-type cytochrome [Chlorobiales bacterium]